jgi:hypothetical protein
MIKQLLAAAAALALAAPLAAQADQIIPSYAAQTDQEIQGRVYSFDGGYNLQVRDNNGYVDNVELHDGTVINPTGITLAPGMIVSILGSNAGSEFDANQIDTPYSFYGDVPYYGGHPWNFWGPSVGFNFFFGNTGWWQHPWFHGGYGGFYRGVAYAPARIENVTVVNRYQNQVRVIEPARDAAPRFAPPRQRDEPLVNHFSGEGRTAMHSAAPSRDSHADVHVRGRR